MAARTLGMVDDSLRSIVKWMSKRLSALTSILIPDDYATSRDRKLIDRMPVIMTIDFGENDPFPVEATFRLDKDQYGRPVRDAFPGLKVVDVNNDLALDYEVPCMLGYASDELADPNSQYVAQARCCSSWSDKGLEFEVYLGGSYACTVMATWAESYDILSHVFVETIHDGPMLPADERRKIFRAHVDELKKSGEYIPAGLLDAAGLTETSDGKKAKLVKKAAS